MDNPALHNQFPEMFQFLGYLNQDYTIYGPDLEDAVNAFIGDSTVDQIAATRAEMARFLALKANDLDTNLERLGNGYAYDVDMTAHEYLLRLDGLLAEGLATKLP